MRILLAALTLSLAASGQQNIELGTPFADNMVLQRGMPVPIWGWANPGEGITVSFASQTRQTKADDKGRWRLSLEPLEASANERPLVVRTDAGESKLLRGVLVGEVWFASGQSNMDWIAGKSMCRELASQVARDQLPIREFNVDIGSTVFRRERTTCKDGWKSSRQASGFSALALAFAAELHAQLNVPIGILRSTHGATAIETWTPYVGFAERPDLAHIAKRVRDSDPMTGDGLTAYAQFYRDLETWRDASAAVIERGGKPLPRPNLPGIAGDWKGATRMFNMKIAPLIPFAIRGVIWCQGTHNSGDGRIYAAKMHALLNGLRKEWQRPELPFYFTQMQCYGDADPAKVGFADIREAQRVFFMDAENVGMVPQYDLNPARPQGIHYSNKLDPGKRLARWALAREYGQEIAYCGPLYRTHTVNGGTVRVTFEQRGPGGGLMVGSKGMEADAKNGGYVEPARPTPGAPLAHFRLAGRDRVWHEATARIDGDAVLVTSSEVEEPVGVSYAYSQSPIGANLYSTAGLPATPFAVFDGKVVFQEDFAEPAKPQTKAEPAPYVSVATLFRPGAVVQRDMPLPVWGFAKPGSRVTVEFAGQSKTATTGEFEQWRLDLAPLEASAEPRTLTVRTDDGASRTVENVLVGDVWFLTGSRQVPGSLVRSELEPMPLVREFRIKTKARRFREPRKRRMEIGGGRYESSWQPMTFDGEGTETSVAGYHFAKQVMEPGVPVGIVTLGADNPPITWLSREALQTAEGFEAERDELNQIFPNTEAGRAAVAGYIKTLRRYNDSVVRFLRGGYELPGEIASGPPGFPQPEQNQWAPRTENATLTYNFCISPLTPHAARGLAWIPGNYNLGSEPSRYGKQLEAWAASLDATFGQKMIFVHALPDADLGAAVPGGVRPDGRDPAGVAAELGRAARSRQR